MDDGGYIRIVCLDDAGYIRMVCVWMTVGTYGWCVCG